TTTSTYTCITVDAKGSLDGVSELLSSDWPERSRLVTFSDGRAANNSVALVGRPVALLTFGVIVNAEARIDNLSLEQLQGVYQGRYTNWRQLGGTVDLPIRIVSRGAESGSRRTFERYVLNFSEGAVSSNSCIERDRILTASIIRCERNSTTELL